MTVLVHTLALRIFKHWREDGAVNGEGRRMPRTWHGSNAAVYMSVIYRAQSAQQFTSTTKLDLRTDLF